ncbi:MAG: helix-turn-helix domain-containing protein, partial [Bacteroidales bacterium]|nr:helix-turn-helix domain-containing protein [Bacteroidales bacterium]
LRKSRLQYGRKLLAETTKTISEIAYNSGFSSPAYFTKCFKDEYGIAPGEMR